MVIVNKELITKDSFHSVGQVAVTLPKFKGRDLSWIQVWDNSTFRRCRTTRDMKMLALQSKQEPD